MDIICRKAYLLEPLRNAFPQFRISEQWDLPGAEIVIAEPSELVAEHLERLPDLAMAQCARAGYDAADCAYLQSRKIKLCNAKGLYSEPIAEDIVCKILFYTTNAWNYTAQKAEHLYCAIPQRSCLRELTVGFLGTGSIAQTAAMYLNAFGCRKLGYKRSAVPSLAGFDRLYYGEDGLRQLLSESDLIVITLELNRETYHRINSETIRQMRQGAAIINVARGEVIDEKALIAALQAGWIRYAGLDVFEEEPLPGTSPLWDMPQVMLTPHAAGMCSQNHARLAQLVTENVRRYLDGLPLKNQVF
jgi:phosphoglycerate dehydrogenase-like enzyme